MKAKIYLGILTLFTFLIFCESSVYAYDEKVYTPDEIPGSIPVNRKYTITSTYTPGIAMHPVPSKESADILRAPYGTEFYATALYENYAYTMISGEFGWINTDYAAVDINTVDILTPDNVPAANLDFYTYYEITNGVGSGIPVYPEPNNDSYVLTVAKAGLRFPGMAKYNNYVFTKINGFYGWINIEHAKELEPNGLFSIINETTDYYGSVGYNPYNIHEVSEFSRAYLWLMNGFSLNIDPSDSFNEVPAQFFYLLDFDFDGDPEILVCAKDDNYAYHWELLDNQEEDMIWTVARDLTPKPGNAGHTLKIINGNCIVDESWRCLVGYDAEWVTYVYFADGRINYLQSLTYIEHTFSEDFSQRTDTETHEYKLNGDYISKDDYDIYSNRYRTSHDVLVLDEQTGIPITSDTLSWLKLQERITY